MRRSLERSGVSRLALIGAVALIFVVGLVAGGLITHQNNPSPNQSPQLNLPSSYGNSAPIADAGPDQTVLVEKAITFDGTRSRDPDGTIVNYSWDFGDGSSEKGAVVNHLYYYPGQYPVTLTVTDDGGASSWDSCVVTITYISLDVQVLSTSENWYRDYSTDLPRCQVTITYSITNSGTAVAENVEASLLLDNSRSNLPAHSDLNVGQVIFDQTVLDSVCDTEHQVIIYAESWKSESSYSFDWDTTFPRDPRGQTQYLNYYVTPRERTVVDVHSDILENKFPLKPNLWAIRDWVASNTNYADDDLKHGGEYFQFPWETLRSGTGDCEDFAILLVSLLRADGYGPDSVYVMVGYNGRSGHAWVVVKDLGIWWTIEPQLTTTEGILWTFTVALYSGQLTEVSGYKAEYMFNDQGVSIIT